MICPADHRPNGEESLLAVREFIVRGLTGCGSPVQWE